LKEKTKVTKEEERTEARGKQNPFSHNQREVGLRGNRRGGIMVALRGNHSKNGVEYQTTERDAGIVKTKKISQLPA